MPARAIACRDATLDPGALKVLLDARIAGITPQDEVRACIAELMRRGWKHRQIAARIGVSVRTISHWRWGEKHLLDEGKLIALARLTRAMLPVKPNPPREFVGIQRVVWQLCLTLSVTQEELSRRVGCSKSVCSRYLRGLHGPNRMVTLRLLKLAQLHGLAPEYVQLCEQRLEKIWQQEQKARELLSWLARRRPKRLARPSVRRLLSAYKGDSQPQ